MSKPHILITGAGGFIGGYHVITMLGKLVLNQLLYRYSIKDYRPGVPADCKLLPSAVRPH